jgi:hypothetical protein
VKERTKASPLPILVVIVLAAMSLIQLLAPSLLHPGLTLLLIGLVFVVLHFVRWVDDPVTLISGWVLAGFGGSFWALSYGPLTEIGLPLLLFGLGVAFVGIFLTSRSGAEVLQVGRNWPLVPGIVLLLTGATLVLEGAIGRERLWSMVVPLIPAVVAIWYLLEWRRSTGPTTHEVEPPTSKD